MSRIGKKPVVIPANVTVDVAEGNVVTVERPDEEHLHKSLHGLTRTLLNNMVEGV